MPGNKYVGRTTGNNTGLMLKSKAEIDSNEFGLLQSNFKFTLKNENWPTLDPSQGTPLSQLTPGDALTQSVFTAYGTYLGKQTSRFTRHGEAPGIGLLEMVCQGAVFPSNQPTASIVSIPLTSYGSGYASAPTVNITGGGQVLAAIAVARLSLASASQSAGGSGYSNGDLLTLSGGNFDRPATIIVDNVSAGALDKIRIFDAGQYSSIPTSPASVTGGTGTGATINISWKVGYIVVVDGGSYTSTPTATISGGGYSTPATLGPVNMSNFSGGGQILITNPWKPISTSKDTVQVPIYGVANTHYVVKYATVSELPSSIYFTVNNGTIALQVPQFGGPIPAIDGRRPSVGDLILVKNETRQYRNGIYYVFAVGDAVTRAPWILYRAPGFTVATNYRTTLYVDVQSGDTNHDTIWNCSTNIATLAASDSSGGDNIIFLSSTNTSTHTLLYRVTIEYHAIDLHFEYVANRKLQQPQFVADNYSMDADGFVIIDTTSGDKMLLKIDSVYTETAITDSVTGNVTYKPASIQINRATWQAAVHFLGTASRFEQTPAGQYWHVLETTSIKIVPVQQTP